MQFFGARANLAKAVLRVVDTGIDYGHEVFRNGDGSTRIVSIWDQTIQSDNVPTNFTFGTEFSREQINAALRTENPSLLVQSNDTNGHGTAIASIIAGKENKEHTFQGVVPNAELVIVKLKPAKKNLHNIFSVREDAICYQGTDIVLGIRYLYEVALQLKRPIVICQIGRAHV